MNGRANIAHDEPSVRRPDDRGFAPRGLRREAAAWYLGVSPTKFDDWVSEHVMPAPKKQGGVVVWDRRKLDEAFEALPDREAESKENPFQDFS